MAYTNLSTFCAALASYGKNFQQYLDGVPTLTLRQAAATELGQLCDSMTAYNGNSFTNLKALATALSATNEVQNILSQQALSLRNSARTEFTQLISDFNALEVEEGLAAGSYGAATTVIDAILAAGMPNDLGQWSDKLTTSQIANAATAIAAIGTRADTYAFPLFGIPGLELFMDAEVGITYEYGGDTPNTGTGTADNVSAWTNRTSGGEVFIQANAASQPVVDADGINGRDAIYFSGSEYLRKAGNAILSGQIGSLFLLYAPYSNADSHVIYSQSSNSNVNYAAMYTGVGAYPRFDVTVASNNSALYTTTQTQTLYAPTLLSVTSNGTTTSMRYNGVAKTVGAVAGTNTGRWFGDISSATLSNSIGCHYTTTAIQLQKAKVAAIIAYDGVSLTSAQLAAIESYLATRGGISLP